MNAYGHFGNSVRKFRREYWNHINGALQLGPGRGQVRERARKRERERERERKREREKERERRGVKIAKKRNGRLYGVRRPAIPPAGPREASSPRPCPPPALACASQLAGMGEGGTRTQIALRPQPRPGTASTRTATGNRRRFQTAPYTTTSILSESEKADHGLCPVLV